MLLVSLLRFSKNFSLQKRTSNLHKCLLDHDFHQESVENHHFRPQLTAFEGPKMAARPQPSGNGHGVQQAGHKDATLHGSHLRLRGFSTFDSYIGYTTWNKT